MSNNIEVSQIIVYPVKSLAGISLKSAEMTPLGLKHDRSFMLTMPNGRFMTQRQFPKMALIKTAIVDETLVFSKVGLPDYVLPLSMEGGDDVTTQVWRDECEVLDMGDEISAWLTEAVESKFAARLVRMKPGFNRPQSKPERYGDDVTTLFADGAPYLVTSEESLQSLNNELTNKELEAVPMNRFRPNIVVRGSSAFSERQIEALQGSDYKLELRFPCERCIMTTINQQTAEKHPEMEPFETLRQLNPMPNKNAPAFGENAIFISEGSKTITVGEQLTVIS